MISRILLKNASKIAVFFNRAFFDELGEKHPLLKAKILNQIALQLCDRLRQANIEISALRN